MSRWSVLSGMRYEWVAFEVDEVAEALSVLRTAMNRYQKIEVLQELACQLVDSTNRVMEVLVVPRVESSTNGKPVK